ncbi:MAG: undecaprenyldiphospho-muramoylpentapeptide beta-N-acetylglucosaminyltransferase [Deltaproteobacteria bacterium]|nr:undecaprenyldiphospho-muramoylpentapeptide beta-N-acetylglucosaminyltransferase [Deltaproteobacteria bacterium]
MRLLIAGGGTGGHLYPGIAVAEELLGRGSGHSVLFAGTERGLEARVLPALGLAFEPLRARGLVGAGALGTVRALWAQALALADARRILDAFRPDACLGVGGYSSFPVVALAWLRRVPTAIQEQNARPGLANRVLARVVRRVYAGDEAAATLFPAEKVRVTGNPLRRALTAALPYASPRPNEPARLLVVGGSQGARALNEALPAALARISRPLAVVHQAGRGNAADVSARYGDRADVSVVEFIDDMASAYGRAHLVIARAGALTLAELSSAGRPAVLVPFPFAAGGHQEANARAAEGRGAAVLILEPNLTPQGLAETLSALLAAGDRLTAMAAAAERSARRDAAAAIVDDLFRLAAGQPGSRAA